MNGSDATTELLAAIVAWVAKQESQRRSERIKAGLARRRAEGKPASAASRRGKDRKPRRTDGYVEAWKQRKAALCNGLNPGTNGARLPPPGAGAIRS